MYLTQVNYHYEFCNSKLFKDPAPEFFEIGPESSSKRILSAMREYCNNSELSDIKFVVEGKPFYGHKIVLSLLR